MYNQPLQVAHTGAFSGFVADGGSSQGGVYQTKAGQFFDEYRKKEAVRRIIHDRELPQSPPHYYVPGAPSPLHYGIPLSDEYDPGVYAVSSALFGGSGAFKVIPIETRPIFRRRRRGDCFPEWSNAFVTRVDPCECVSPEETYTPYEVARYRDQTGRMRTTLDFSA